MCKVCLYFDLDIPLKFTNYRLYDIKQHSNYFDKSDTKNLINDRTKKSYLPLNKTLLDLIKKHKGKFKITFSISGSTFYLIKKFEKELMKSFKDLAKTGSVEFVLRPFDNLLVSIELLILIS